MYCYIFRLVEETRVERQILGGMKLARANKLHVGYKPIWRTEFLLADASET